MDWVSICEALTWRYAPHGAQAPTSAYPVTTLGGYPVTDLQPWHTDTAGRCGAVQRQTGYGGYGGDRRGAARRG